MFFDKKSKEIKKKRKEYQKKIYQRVYELHQEAEFLCYINDAYLETDQNEKYMKLEGIVATGIGRIEDTFLLYDCDGNQKGIVKMLEFYLGNQSVSQLEGGDQKVALYPEEQGLPYKAGDILCKLKCDV